MRYSTPNCDEHFAIYDVTATIYDVHSPTNYFDEFIQRKISAGRYKNASEVVRAGLRLLEEEENKIIALRAATQEGIESGIAIDFEPESHLKKLKANKSRNICLIIYRQ